MKITEIEVDDSQTGHIWIQIYAANQKQAISLRHQIFDDQAIRERLENEIKQSQSIVENSTNEMEMAVQNLLISKLYGIIEGKKEST